MVRMAQFDKELDTQAVGCEFNPRPDQQIGITIILSDIYMIL